MINTHRLKYWPVLFLLCAPALSFGNSQKSWKAFEKTRDLISADKPADALKELAKLEASDRTSLSSIAFTRGVLLFEMKKDAEAVTAFEQALKSNTALTAYAQYHMGLIHSRQGEPGKAVDAFRKAIAATVNRELKNHAQYNLGDTLIKQGRWKEALSELKPLEKKLRRDVEYPDLVWRLLKIATMRNDRATACKWARKLYVDFPAYPGIADWSFDMKSAAVDGKKLTCQVSSKDQTRRIRRLQWAGESDRARKEIETLKDKDKSEMFYENLLASFLISEGHVDEALQMLLQKYETGVKNFKYLVLLARAAARAGEYQTAVGAYYKAYRMNPRSKAGKEALFQAAFLSYQFQDYDGASRKFQQFVEKYSRSGLRRDAQWHLAWIRYLRGDFEGALKGFSDIERTKSRRARRNTSDRVQYWTAMSYLRLERFNEARAIFSRLSDDKNITFYALASKYRLLSMPTEATLAPTPVPRVSFGEVLTPNIDQAGSYLPNPDDVAKTAPADDEDTESEEDLKTSEKIETASETGDDEGADSDASSDSEDEEQASQSDEDEGGPATTFKDPRLQAFFDRARELTTLGFYEWARWELYEIERKTRNPSYLKSLMTAYELVHSYHRSAYIGETYFSPRRVAIGAENGRSLWEFAFPQAYQESVTTYAKKFGIPEEMVWAIMRAESHYKSDVISPVGAKGLMQIMPQTAKQLVRLMNEGEFSEEQLIDADTNIRWGARYLARLSEKFEGLLPLIAASYNAGPHRTENWVHSFGNLEMDEFIEHIPFLETRDYVKKVVRNFGVYKTLYSPKSASLAWLTQPLKFKLSGPPSTREVW